MERFSKSLENTDKGLHTKTSEDDGNPADGSEKNGFSTGFDHSDQIGFETDSTHGHDNKEFGELFEGVKKLLDTPREVSSVVRREARIK